MFNRCLICQNPAYEDIRVETENGLEQRRIKINHKGCWNTETELLEKKIFQTEERLLKLRHKLANILCKQVVMDLQNDENNL